MQFLFWVVLFKASYLQRLVIGVSFSFDYGDRLFAGLGGLWGSYQVLGELYVSIRVRVEIRVGLVVFYMFNKIWRFRWVY